ncbi:MAG: hypothetical protein WHV44_02250, partial [Anaerolineales bacterium]
AYFQIYTNLLIIGIKNAARPSDGWARSQVLFCEDKSCNPFSGMIRYFTLSPGGREGTDRVTHLLQATFNLQRTSHSLSHHNFCPTRITAT